MDRHDPRGCTKPAIENRHGLQGFIADMLKDGKPPEILEFKVTVIDRNEPNAWDGPTTIHAFNIRQALDQMEQALRGGHASVVSIEQVD